MTTDPDLRLTPQRRAVLEVLATSTDHPTAAEVTERVRARLPGVGPATVYRTLALLVDAGLAAEVTLGDGGSTRYDRTVSEHDHVVCGACGTVADVRVPLQRGALDRVAADLGFTVTRVDLTVHGLCHDCATPAAPVPSTSPASPHPTTTGGNP